MVNVIYLVVNQNAKLNFLENVEIFVIQVDYCLMLLINYMLVVMIAIEKVHLIFGRLLYKTKVYISNIQAKHRN